MKWNFLYEMKAASRTPEEGAAACSSPFCRPLSSTEFVELPRTKFLGTPLFTICFPVFHVFPFQDICTRGEQHDLYQDPIHSVSVLLLASSLRWSEDVAGVTRNPAKATVFQTRNFSNLESTSVISFVWENLCVHSRIILRCYIQLNLCWVRGNFLPTEKIHFFVNSLFAELGGFSLYIHAITVVLRVGCNVISCRLFHFKSIMR